MSTLRVLSFLASRLSESNDKSACLSDLNQPDNRPVKCPRDWTHCYWLQAFKDKTCVLYLKRINGVGHAFLYYIRSGSYCRALPRGLHQTPWPSLGCSAAENHSSHFSAVGSIPAYSGNNFRYHLLKLLQELPGLVLLPLNLP